MADNLNKKNLMEISNHELFQLIQGLQRENIAINTAANFLFYNIVDILDQQSGDKKFSDELKTRLHSELSKITTSGKPEIKVAINTLMQPPVRPMFGNTSPEPFLK
ncbi:hypothetical protein ACQJPW_005327 [Escherichia coli]